jgi:hypothetical protein
MRHPMRLGAWGLCLFIVAGCVSCRAQDRSPAGTSSADALRYPPAQWRLLPWSGQDAIVLWVSHIQISFRESGRDAILRPMGWAPDAAQTRSREQAEELAERIAREAREHPDRFEALARQHSDDSVTRHLEGSLGGVRATQLPGAYVDALSALSPGDVSSVIFTGTAYTILLRRAPPPREDVAGRRIVIRYAGTLGADNPAEGRSHEEARTLASQVVARARAKQAAFTDLVAQYSEHADRAHDGDLGTWSTREPGDRPREVETLSRLKVGDVSDPIESVWGFQIIQRIAPEPHHRYAAATIRLRIKPGMPSEDPRSRPSVERDARVLAGKLHADPASFASVQAQYDSASVEIWDYGHGSLPVTARLDELRLSEVAEEPIYEGPFFYTVVMRLDPALVAKQQASPSYDLPLRVRPDVEAVFHDADSSLLLKYLTDFSHPEVAGMLAFTSAESAVWRTTLEVLRLDLGKATTPDERARVYRDASRRLHEGMSAASYSRVMTMVEHQVARIRLSGS